MKRRVLLAGTVCLAVVSAGLAGMPTNRFTVGFVNPQTGGGSFLAVRGGELTLGGLTFAEVPDTQDAADRWYVSGSQIKSSVGGGYLAFDPTGRSNRVFLTQQPGPGTDWLVGRARLDGGRGAIQAASGPLRGWYLAVEGDGEGEGDGPVRAAGARPAVLVLSKDPARRLEAERIYHHK